MYRHDVFSFIILLGAIQGIFLSYFLIKKHENQISAVFLGLMLLFFALLNLDFWAAYTLITLRFPHLLDISVPLSLVMGPLVYHYSRHFLFAERQKNLIVHYFPAIFLLVYSMYFYLQPADFKYNVFVMSRDLHFPLRVVNSHFSPDPLYIRQFTGIFVTCQLITYLVLSLRTFYLYISGKKLNAKKLTPEGIHWLRNTLVAAFVMVMIAGGIQLFYSGGREEYILASSFTLFIYFTSYQLLRNSLFYKQGMLREKYSKSSLNGVLKDDLVRKIDGYMEIDKPYLDNLFSLKSFARAVSASPNHLSQVLNEQYGMSFFEFIAGFRIREAQRILSDPNNRNIKIEQLAYQVGYNSKAAFNRAFKNITGQTPLIYKKGRLI